MAAVSRAFLSVPEKKGLTIGVLPGGECGRIDVERDYPNAWVELPIYTHLPFSGTRGTEPLSRNHINVLSSDVLIALPGSHGTASEVQLAVRYDRPLIAYVRTRMDIAGLPARIPVATELATVQEFVRARIA